MPSDSTRVTGPTERLDDIVEALRINGWQIRGSQNGGPTASVEVEGVGHEWVEHLAGQFGYYKDDPQPVSRAQVKILLSDGSITEHDVAWPDGDTLGDVLDRCGADCAEVVAITFEASSSTG